MELCVHGISPKTQHIHSALLTIYHSWISMKPPLPPLPPGKCGRHRGEREEPPARAPPTHTDGWFAKKSLFEVEEKRSQTSSNSQVVVLQKSESPLLFFSSPLRTNTHAVPPRCLFTEKKLHMRRKKETTYSFNTEVFWSLFEWQQQSKVGSCSRRKVVVKSLRTHRAVLQCQEESVRTPPKHTEGRKK